MKSAVLRLHVVCPSVTLVDQDHIRWKSWNLIARTIIPTSSLFEAQRPSAYSQGNMGNFGETTVWVKKIPPWGFLTFFPKRLGIFSPNFTRLLYVPIYARVQIFIQLPATLTKLCHIKCDHPVHIICSMFTIGRNGRVQMFAKVVDGFVDRCLWQVITDLLQCTF